MTVLVTGGAGYIGSHMALCLLEHGRSVVVLDNLSTGRRSLVPDGAAFVQGEVADAPLVKSTIDKFHIGSIIHFAASVVVPESVQKPLDYYSNNAASSLSLIRTCVETGVKNFLFRPQRRFTASPSKTRFRRMRRPGRLVPMGARNG